jgi:hypothetical protein
LESKSNNKRTVCMYNSKAISRQELKESCTVILQNIDSEYNAFISFADVSIEEGSALSLCSCRQHLCGELKNNLRFRNSGRV